jgi:hypothetical protein
MSALEQQGLGEEDGLEASRSTLATTKNGRRGRGRAVEVAGVDSRAD